MVIIHLYCDKIVYIKKEKIIQYRAKKEKMGGNENKK